MTAETQARAELARLVAEIAADRAAAAARRDEITALRASAPWPPGAPALSVVALALHHYYSAVESVLERIARVYEGSLPQGPDTHRRLLDVTSLELAGIRPAVLSPATRDALGNLLRFRHFLRHAYAVALAPDKLAARADDVARVAPLLDADLDRFIAHVERSIAALAK